MDRLVAADSPDSLREFCALPGQVSLTPEQIREHRADASRLVTDGAGRPAARCSLWWNSVPRLRNERIGLIGHYASTDFRAAADLLRSACEELSRQGCTLAVGPMDGSTWRNYRFITDRGHEPIFFLEPDNADEWPAQFSAAGFFLLAPYFSTLIPDLRGLEISTSGRTRRVTGVEIRSLRTEAFEEELRKIYAVVAACFGGNFLYTPISERDFIAQSLGLRRWVQPELVLLAEWEGAPVGFVFAIADIAQLSRAPQIDTVVVKTLGVVPECGGAGLGGLLVERVQQAARELGYRRAIHALMHEHNLSRRINAAKAQTIRTYALFARRLRTAP